MVTDSNRTRIEVTLAGPGDISRLAPLFDAYRQFYEQPADLLGAERFLAERLIRGESVVFLAEASHGLAPATLAGFTQLYRSFSSVSMEPLYILNDLYVVPGSRRLGAARALLEHARDFASSTGATSMVLQTAVTNKAAQALYESLGWRRDDLYYTYELGVS
ncbi:MAG: GNAT family N-acetyltransferase [Ktedonobacterales bacterium]